MAKKLNLLGMQFGRLSVVERKITDDKRNSHWMCQCECGKEKIVTGSNLSNGTTLSCGCLDAERKLKHGLSDTRLYKIHHAVIRRCTNPKDFRYMDYGGRGISVCTEWLGESGLENFYVWATDNGYSDDLSIDRIDTNGNYEPSNCKWATDIEQNNNKRTNTLLTVDGVTKTVAEWARELDISPMTIRSRIRAGWDNDKLLSPAKAKRKTKGDV